MACILGKIVEKFLENSGVSQVLGGLEPSQGPPEPHTLKTFDLL